MKLLVTGGCGFIGTNFIRLILREHPDDSVVNLDRLTYAGNPENLRDLEDEPRYEFVQGDVADPDCLARCVRPEIDAIVHFAAESHVDRSILNSEPFLRTNVLGTQSLLDAARRAGTRRFIHISTDEVYGSLGAEGKFTETSPLQPNSPYAASKAAADFLVQAAGKTFGLPVIVTRCTNNFGPYQFPEKIIPLFLANAMADRPLPLYGDGQNVREWIHVEDHCRAVDILLRRGRIGEVYNIGSGAEIANLELTRTLLRILGKPESLITFVKDRPGHDRRYALDSTKLRHELGWRPRDSFQAGLEQTVQWYRDHQAWCERIRSGDYRRYYEEQYGDRHRTATPAPQEPSE